MKKEGSLSSEPEPKALFQGPLGSWPEKLPTARLR
jgi:hypothetical protein